MVGTGEGWRGGNGGGAFGGRSQQPPHGRRPAGKPCVIAGVEMHARAVVRPG